MLWLFKQQWGDLELEHKGSARTCVKTEVPLQTIYSQVTEITSCTDQWRGKENGRDRILIWTLPVTPPWDKGGQGTLFGGLWCGTGKKVLSGRDLQSEARHPKHFLGRCVVRWSGSTI